MGSGVAIDLGLANCINTLEFVASDGASGASGGLQVPKKKWVMETVCLKVLITDLFVPVKLIVR